MAFRRLSVGWRAFERAQRDRFKTALQPLLIDPNQEMDPLATASWWAACPRGSTWLWRRRANRPRPWPGRCRVERDRPGLPRHSNGREAFDLDEMVASWLLPATVTFSATIWQRISQNRMPKPDSWRISARYAIRGSSYFSGRPSPIHLEDGLFASGIALKAASPVTLVIAKPMPIFVGSVVSTATPSFQFRPFEQPQIFANQNCFPAVQSARLWRIAFLTGSFWLGMTVLGFPLDSRIAAWSIAPSRRQRSTNRGGSFYLWRPPQPLPACSPV